MKKLVISFIACLFLFTGCGKDVLSGSWSGESNDGLKATFTFDNGKVTYKNDYFENDGTYTIEDNKVTIKEVWDNEKVYEFKVDGKTLSLTATDLFSPSYKSLKK